MNLKDMTARVRHLAGVQIEELVPDSRIKELLNEAYLELCGLNVWPFLHVAEQVEVAAGDDEVELPSPMQRLSSVVWSDSDGDLRLGMVTVDEIERLALDEGRPVGYALKAVDTLVLSPEPDEPGTLSLRGVRQASQMSDDLDAPLFDAEFHVGLAYAAAARLLAEEGDDSGRADAYVGEAGGVLQRMQQRYLVSHDTAVFQIGGRRSGRRRRWRMG